MANKTNQAPSDDTVMPAQAAADVHDALASLSERLHRNPYADLIAAIGEVDVEGITTEQATRSEEIAKAKQALADANARIIVIRDELDSRVVDRQGAARRFLAGERVLPQPRAELEAERDWLLKEAMPGLRQMLREFEEDATYQHPALDPVVGAANALVPAILERARSSLATGYADAFTIGRSLRAEALMGLATSLGQSLADLIGLGVFSYQNHYAPSRGALAVLEAATPA